MIQSGSIPNLINGVSQQSPQMRLPSQAEVSENTLPSVVSGLGRRPGTRFVARVAGAAWQNALLHTIDRGDGERYVVAITGGDLRVFDLATMAEQTVSFPDGKGYLVTGGLPSSTSFRATTVVDYTFIVNRTVTAVMAETTSPARPNRALVTVVNYGTKRTFRIYVGGVMRAETITGDLEGESAEGVNTEAIASELATQLSTNLPSGDYSVSRKGNTIVITKTSAGDLSVRSEDSDGGKLVRVTAERVQVFSDLPGYAPTGYTTEIVGTEGSVTPYWVRHDSKSSNDDTGVWVETVGPGVHTTILASSMPHILVRNADGTFTFRRATWADRKVGTTITAPRPGFIGRTISDVVFVRNRLGLVSGEGVDLSRSGDLYNFWPQTVTQLLDDDRIGITSTGTEVATINFAVPYNKDLVLFAEKAQLMLLGGEMLTPKTVDMPPISAFPASSMARPLVMGSVVYFTSPSGAYSTVREWQLGPDGESAIAPAVTAHVPRYVPAGVTQIVGSTAGEDTTLVFLSNTVRNRLHVYRSHVNGNERLQSAWSDWTFSSGDAILAATFVRSDLYLLIQRSGGVTLERMSLEDGATDDGSTIAYHLDGRFYETAMAAPVYADGFTTWTLPMPVSGLTAIIRAGDTEEPEGFPVPITQPTSTTARAEGDWTARKVCFGRPFTTRHRLSTLYLRRSTATSSVALTAGRTQVKRVTLYYDESGPFTATVYTPGRAPAVTERADTSSWTGGPDSLPIWSGELRFPVGSRNTDAAIEITVDGPFPAYFMSADWTANFTPRPGSSDR